MTKRFFIPLVLVALLAFTGCDNDDDDINVSQEFNAAFDALYPNATRVSWEKKASYYVADFWRTDLDAEAEAWFEGNAQWQMTVTEINYKALPQPVKASHEAGEYADWRVEDTDMVEREGYETVYILEVEKGEQEYDLYYIADGTLVKAVVDTEGDDDPSDYIPQEISSAINEFIQTTYPGAKIIETEHEGNYIEVDILDAKTPRELSFTTEGKWQFTKTEIRKSEVPQTIMDAFNSSAYSDYKVDDTDHYSSPDGEFYLFELESEPNDIHIKITADGNIEAIS